MKNLSLPTPVLCSDTSADILDEKLIIQTNADLCQKNVKTNNENEKSSPEVKRPFD
jgi:hypothetical protein